ncbi:MAG: LysM peptidoglycan-binding domain-containing protein [bacterium]|nr:LysM peptidoglycan-binding domain-containing protein [bacterium]
MNLIIPFEKKVKFDTPISEICSISLEHEITKNDSEILGNFLITGTYKEHELSVNKTDFNFTLPFSVELTTRVDLSSLDMSIDNFTYDLNGSDLDIKIDYVIEAQELKEEPIFERVEEESEPITLIEEKEEITNNVVNDNEEREIKSETIINSVKAEDDYISYHIHIVSSGESLESIALKYHITKEEIENINNITSITENDKLLIPLENE